MGGLALVQLVGTVRLEDYLIDLKNLVGKIFGGLLGLIVLHVLDDLIEVIYSDTVVIHAFDLLVELLLDLLAVGIIRSEGLHVIPVVFT
jgi:hypothetical protein